jgi:galactoside O-acetyltransferase
LIPDSELQAHLGFCGVGVKIYRGCRIVPPGRVRIGDRSQVDEGVLIFAGEGVQLGRHVHIAIGASISGGGSCEIQSYAGVGAAVRLITGTEESDGNGLTNPTIPNDLRRVRRGRVVIGSHALVFTGSVVLPGVTIGEGAIVAAGSLVHHDLRPWGIYAGHPLVQIGVRPRDRVLEAARRLEETS